MPRVTDVLREKEAQGRAELVTISPDATALDAAQLMNKHHVGALVVTDKRGGMLGVFTERDVLTRVVAPELPPGATVVGDVMTTNVVCCEPKDLLGDMRTLMRERRIRHVPVVEQGRLIGMISIGDLNAAEAKVMIETINYLEQYSYRP